MGEFDELDAAMADTRAARERLRHEALDRHAATVDFHRRFREWAESTAAPVLEGVADHVRSLYQYSSMHVHHPDRGAGGRESVALNVSLLGQYVELTFRALVPQLAVGVSENHGAETTEALETLTADVIRHRAIRLITQAVAKAGQAD